MKMTVADLIATLEEMPADAEVRLASQPNWPFEHELDDVQDVVSEDDGKSVVYLAEGSQLGYLPGEASEALGWRWR